jgi:chorismate lyase/3-hydroxybenzoate synthase
MAAHMARAVAPKYVPLASPDPTDELLARIAYGQAAPGAVFVDAPQLGGAPVVEAWPATRDLVFGSMHVDDSVDVERDAREIYERVIAEARAKGAPHFVRMWNYVGGINGHDGGRERYQLFCAGRHEAFAAAGIPKESMPAASAVGMNGRGLVTCYLASATPGVQVENPRQVSAYCYPPQYGPKSPSFARATLWNGTLFVSGTSSVVGHETLHAGDLDAQLDETLRNLEVVIDAAFPGGGLSRVVAAKTYVRHARDAGHLERRLAKVFPANLFLRSDICRADLLLEIEVVAR